MSTRASGARRLHGWRKLAGAAWGRPNDPQFYGELEIDAGALLEHQRQVRDRTGTHVTMTHLVGRAVGHALSVVPAARVRIAFGREYPRTSADVFFIVSADGGDELTGVKIENVDQKPVDQVAAELNAAILAIADGTDASFGRTKRILDALPVWALRPMIRAGARLTSDLGLDLPRLGLPRDAFGGAMVTSVGMWGVTRAYSPLAGYYRVPVLVLVGAVRQRPVAVAGEVVIRPILTVTATFDHRYVDGAHAAQLAQAIQAYCANPPRFEPADGGSPSATAHGGLRVQSRPR